MKKFFFLISLFLVAVYSCQNGNSITGPFPSGQFAYQAYDTLGTLIVKGSLSLNFLATNQIEGSWRLNQIVQRENIGNQIGAGKLIGNVENSKIMINLNPQWTDNNVHLIGTIKGDTIQGKWYYSTFVGAVNWGKFLAVRR